MAFENESKCKAHLRAVHQQRVIVTFRRVPLPMRTPIEKLQGHARNNCEGPMAQLTIQTTFGNIHRRRRQYRDPRWSLARPAPCGRYCRLDCFEEDSLGD